MSHRSLWILCLALLLCVSLCGCSYQDLHPGTPKRKDAQVNYGKGQVNVSMPDAMQKAQATQPHSSPQLVNIKDFNMQKQRALDGVKATQDQSNMSLKEINLWKKVIQDAKFKQVTSADMKAKQREMNDALADLAASKHMTVSQYLAQSDIGMSYQDVQNLFQKQSEKYYETDAQVMAKVNSIQSQME